MNNLSLFSTKPSQSGYRLHAVEVWNWGTFDRDIFSIEPGGEISLLTGGNGSGKTTLVDGLLTLLLPERRARAYNQTAGEKGERTEETYLLGEFGETENSDTNTREVKKLRGDKPWPIVPFTIIMRQKQASWMGHLSDEKKNREYLDVLMGMI